MGRDAGLSGLRVDTLPYPDRGFLAQWRDRVLEEYPALTIVGEEWSVDPAMSSRWQQGPPPARRPAPPHSASLMDFPLQHAFVRGLYEPEGRETGLLRIYQALADDFLYADPGRLVVFPDNHDMSRIYTQLGARLDRWKMAMAFFATVRGTPQFTWGSEILMANPRHGRARRDSPGFSRGLGRATRWMRRRARAFRRPRAKRRTTCGASSRGASPQARFTAGRSRSSRRRTGRDVYVRRDSRQVLLVAFNKNDAERRLETARFAESMGQNTHARDVLTGREFALSSGIVLPAASATILELSARRRCPPA